MKSRRSLRASAILIAIIASFGPAAMRVTGQEAPGATIRAVSSIDMIEGAALLDGSKVAFSGEAIGQAMERGTMAWVNVGDSGGAIGVWMGADVAASIRVFGSYAFRGDTLRITGTFHRACSEHGGDMDIHAGLVEILRTGERVDHPLDTARLAIAVALSLAAALALLLLRAKDKRRHDPESGSRLPGSDGFRET